MRTMEARKIFENNSMSGGKLWGIRDHKRSWHLDKNGDEGRAEALKKLSREKNGKQKKSIVSQK